MKCYFTAVEQVPGKIYIMQFINYACFSVNMCQHNQWKLTWSYLIFLDVTIDVLLLYSYSRFSILASKGYCNFKVYFWG